MPHRCDFCGKTFEGPDNLKKHVKTHPDDIFLLQSEEPHLEQIATQDTYSAFPEFVTNGRPAEGLEAHYERFATSLPVEPQQFDFSHNSNITYPTFPPLLTAADGEDGEDGNFFLFQGDTNESLAFDTDRRFQTLEEAYDPFFGINYDSQESMPNMASVDAWQPFLFPQEEPVQTPVQAQQGNGSYLLDDFFGIQPSSTQNNYSHQPLQDAQSAHFFSSGLDFESNRFQSSEQSMKMDDSTTTLAQRHARNRLATRASRMKKIKKYRAEEGQIPKLELERDRTHVYKCRFPGCAKVFVRSDNLRIHMKDKGHELKGKDVRSELNGEEEAGEREREGAAVWEDIADVEMSEPRMEAIPGS